MQTTDPGFKIMRADHTGITVASLSESLHFWVNVLGFRILSQFRLSGEFLEQIVGVPGADASFATLDGQGHKIELIEYHAPPERKMLRPRSCDVGSVHVAFFVDDIEAVMRRAQEAGWNGLGEIQTRADGPAAGMKLAYVRGPDGVTVEFLQPPVAQ